MWWTSCAESLVCWQSEPQISLNSFSFYLWESFSCFHEEKPEDSWREENKRLFLRSFGKGAWTQRLWQTVSVHTFSSRSKNHETGLDRCSCSNQQLDGSCQCQGRGSKPPSPRLSQIKKLCWLLSCFSWTHRGSFILKTNLICQTDLWIHFQTTSVDSRPLKARWDPFRAGTSREITARQTCPDVQRDKRNKSEITGTKKLINLKPECKTKTSEKQTGLWWGSWRILIFWAFCFGSEYQKLSTCQVSCI